MGAPKGNKYAVGRGRPPGPSHVEICRKWAIKEGWHVLIKMAKDSSEKTIQFQATKLLLAYGFGQPPQGVTLSGNGVIQIVGSKEDLEL